MALFRDWFCTSLLGLVPGREDSLLLERSFSVLSQAALGQQQMCVHRDYHSRNLLYRGENPPGVLDFQDAVIGPVTYDLVSLLKDCYIAWPRERVNGWALEYAGLAKQQGILENFAPETFLRDFDLMGVQRHLKAIGIFARLDLRDGKPGYLNDIPRSLEYIRAVVPEHQSLRELGGWIEETVVPAMEEKLFPLLQTGATL